MKKLNILSALLVLLAFSTACDEITGEFRETIEIEPVDTTKVYQKFLLEDYTGYNCPNCPRAHEKAAYLDSVYEGRIVILGIHVGTLAEPIEEYPYDFRTPEGNTYDEFFENSKKGIPNGMINRKIIENSYIIRHTNWASVINNLLNQEPPADLKLTTSYDESSRKITAKVDLKYLKTSSANDFICVMISEDNIIKFQKDGLYGKIPEYNHRHVLRGGITPAWGVKVSDNSKAVNDRFTPEFTYVIPQDKDWKIDNLSIVAYVYSKDKNYEILQVDSKKLK